MFGWGSCMNGELSLGGIKDENITYPTKISSKFGKLPVKSIVCGHNFTVFVLEDGKVYTCGNNDMGQLGHAKTNKELELVDSLANHVITQVACGCNHTLALSEWGEVFSWGSNSCGQLGFSGTEEYIDVPKLVKYLATKTVVQVACGNELSLVLLRNGQLFSFGKNNYGQLGITTVSEFEPTPVLLETFEGVPVMRLACGGHHCFAITALGAVYGWGRNTFGQLGLNDEMDRYSPTHLKALRSQRVRYISCGENHTVVLTQDGGVFTFGAGTYGQLGHDAFNNEIVPRKVLELMGSSITQIACGRHHTLVYEPKQDCIYAFGQGDNGQLGLSSTGNVSKPAPVKGPWKESSRKRSSDADPPKLTTTGAVKNSKQSLCLKRIFCGGDHSFALFLPFALDGSPDDLRHFPLDGQILRLSPELASECVKLGENELASQEILENVEVMFGSSACINASFLPSGDEHAPCTSTNPRIDYNMVESFFKTIAQIKKTSLVELIVESVKTDLVALLVPSPLDWEALRVYLIIMKCHLFEDPLYYSSLCTPLGKAILNLNSEATQVLESWWIMMKREDFCRLIAIYKMCVVYVLNGFLISDEKDISSSRFTLAIALSILSKLNKVNSEKEVPLPYEEFYIPEISEKIDVRLDYLKWVSLRKGHNSLFFCDFPFLFDAKAKTLILQTDAVLQMQSAMDEVHRRNFTSLFFPVDPANPYLVLIVTRENLVQDALKQLMSYSAKSSNLKKPLKVVFRGEDAVDGGGVRKEFFMLLMKDLIDPKYGMFKIYEETNCIWFNNKTFENEQMFNLIGLLCGLAIYNGNIIDLPFPLALYKKLLSEKTKLDDLRGLSPSLHKSLRYMLDYENEDFAEVFGQYFEITVEAFGEVETHELKPGGTDLMVAKSNREEYVDLYVDFLLNKSVEVQYAAFHDGFHKVLGGRVLELFHSQELMAMVVGNENYDWEELERNTEYKDDFSKGHPTIRMLWEVFHELDLEQKKKFLMFLTGYDRIPIFGMKSLKITIQPTGGGEDFLPVAHTCFNLLDLPRYSKKKNLKEKLLLAIEHTQGFGLA